MRTKEKFDQKYFFKQCRQLLKEQSFEVLVEQICKAVKDEQLDASELAKAGRLLARVETKSNLSVVLLGQCTTSYLVPPLRAWAAADHRSLKVAEEIYDSVLQTALQIDGQVDVVILLPWHQRLFNSSYSNQSIAIEEELQFWKQVWQLIQTNSNAHIIQIGYDWFDGGAGGHYLAGELGGDIHSVRQLNQSLREQLPESAYFLDLEAVSGKIGRRSFYDTRSYYWIKQPFSDVGLAILSQHIWAGIRALTTGRKKVLVLDLDNTLWGGVIGELGPSGIDLGETPDGQMYVDFQQLIKEFSKCGIVLAVCSKNNEADAKEAFQKNPHMKLDLNDFSAFKANWRTKSENILEIAEELNLGLDSFVFFDDSAFEREQVKSALPEVTVLNVLNDPTSYRQTLLDGLWFESVSTTKEDIARTQHYQQEQHRKEVRANYESVDKYLSSLNMRAKIDDINDQNMERVLQLLGKTNQFNLTTRRHSREQLIELLKKQEALGLTFSLEDKFGDYGIVSVLLAYKNSGLSEDLYVDTWLMSCRAIARGVEDFAFNCLLNYAQGKNFKRIITEFIPTAKNSLVEGLFPKLGFVPLVETDHESEKMTDSQFYCLDVHEAQKQECYVLKKPEKLDSNYV